MNDCSSVSRDYSSKSTERLFLCITANFGSSTYGMGRYAQVADFLLSDACKYAAGPQFWTTDHVTRTNGHSS